MPSADEVPARSRACRAQDRPARNINSQSRTHLAHTTPSKHPEHPSPVCEGISVVTKTEKTHVREKEGQAGQEVSDGAQCEYAPKDMPLLALGLRWPVLMRYTPKAREPSTSGKGRE